MADHIWSVMPEAYVIMEHFAENSEEIELSEYGMMIWGNNNYNYAEAAMGYESDLTSASWHGRGWSMPHLVSYMESHDEERLMYKTLTWGNATTAYNTKNPIIALKRLELNVLFFLTIPGPKMIWQFGELGYDISINENGRTGEKPIKWEYFSDSYRHRLYLFYKLINTLRKTEPAFSTDNFTHSLSSITKRLQLNGEDMKVNILGNFGVTSGLVFPAFQQTDRDSGASSCRRRNPTGPRSGNPRKRRSSACGRRPGPHPENRSCRPAVRSIPGPEETPPRPPGAGSARWPPFRLGGRGNR